MKKFIIALLLLMLVIPNAASAHTGLLSSNPANNETVHEPLKQIVMNFETVIEPVSRFTVTDDQGVDYPLADIIINDAQMSGSLTEPLADGTYTVTWKIIGLDGHPVEGKFTFGVEAPAPDETAAPEPSVSAEPSASTPTQTESRLPEASASPSTDPAAQAETNVETEQTTTTTTNPSSNASWLFLALAVAVLVLFAVAVLLKKRKRG